MNERLRCSAICVMIALLQVPHCASEKNFVKIQRRYMDEHCGGVLPFLTHCVQSYKWALGENFPGNKPSSSSPLSHLSPTHFTLHVLQVLIFKIKPEYCGWSTRAYKL